MLLTLDGFNFYERFLKPRSTDNFIYGGHSGWELRLCAAKVDKKWDKSVVLTKKPLPDRHTWWIDHWRLGQDGIGKNSRPIWGDSQGEFYEKSERYYDDPITGKREEKDRNT